MDIGRKVKDDVIARLIADQQRTITHILRTRQGLRRIQSQRVKLHRDLEAERRKVNSDNKATIDSYEEYLSAHNDLAVRLEDELKRMNKQLADTDTALDRLVGPLHVKLWHDKVGLKDAGLFEQWNRVVAVLHRACVVLMAVYLGLIVISVLWVLANREDRAPLKRVPSQERYRSVAKPGTFAMDRYQEYYFSENLKNPLYGTVTSDEIGELKEYLEAETVRSGVPVTDFRKTWNTVRKEAESQEDIFREYASKVREAEGLDGEPTRQEVEQYRLDWVKGLRVRERATDEFGTVDHEAGDLDQEVEGGGGGAEKIGYGVEIIDEEVEEKDGKIEQKEGEVGVNDGDRGTLNGWSILD